MNDSKCNICDHVEILYFNKENKSKFKIDHLDLNKLATEKYDDIAIFYVFKHFLEINFSISRST